MATKDIDPKKILVFGATGNIGAFILRALVGARSSFDKIGLFTSPGTAEKKSSDLADLKSKGVEVVVGDVNSEDDVKKAFAGYDTVVSALGRNVIAAQIPLLKIAEASSTIHTFYPSEYGTDIEYGPSSATEPPHQYKLQVRKYIRESVSRLKVTYLVTGPYPEFFIRYTPWGSGAEKSGSFDPRGKRAVLLGDGKGKISFTTMSDVGRLLVAALKTPQNEQERTLKVNSFTATPQEIVEEFEKQLGGGKWKVDYISMPDLKGNEKEAYETGNPAATGFTLKRIWTEGGTLYEKKDNERVGEPKMETLSEIVKMTIARDTAG